MIMINRVYEVIREAAEKGHPISFPNEKSTKIALLAARNLGFKTETRVFNNKTIIEVKKS